MRIVIVLGILFALWATTTYTTQHPRPEYIHIGIEDEPVYSDKPINVEPVSYTHTPDTTPGRSYAPANVGSDTLVYEDIEHMLGK